ncbi:AAA family ATPase [Prosthecomicrobium sp. N25]|uniref:AAA family ATPase n=1 Tax=Prosthecomicrobium sp. N25 TaxID=3129254 RepID=UPI00307729C6
MFFSRTPPQDKVVALKVTVVAPDPALEKELKAAFAAGPRFSLDFIADTFERAEARVPAEGSAAFVVFLDTGSRNELLALQRFMARTGGRVPVIVVTEGFDEALARWFLQIRVTDFLRKPVEPAELARTCLKAVQAVQAAPAMETKEAEIYTFLPAAGGVGVTTLAVQTAFILQGEKGKSATCLVDLDFQNGACADHLDLEPRLALDEILPNPERLDQHLLDMMLSHHTSGLAVLAAPNRPAEMRSFHPAVVTRLLDLVAQRFDNVVIDLPRTWFPWTDDVLVGSDHFFIVTEMTVPGLRLARRLALAIRERLGDEATPKAIVNRYESRMFGTGLRKSDIEAALGTMLAGVVSNNYRLVREAIDRGVPLHEIKASNNVLADMRKILFAEPGEK